MYPGQYGSARRADARRSRRRRRGASVIGAAARWPTSRLGEAPLALGAAALEVAPRGFRGRELFEGVLAPF